MRLLAACALVCAITLLCGLTARAGNSYAVDFRDTTLRVDYILAGAPQAGRPIAAISSMSKYSGWGGRRVNLRTTPVAGNADVTMTDPATGDTLYIQPFSTLFQEWLSTAEPGAPSAMEGTLLLPMPRSAVNIRITLRDKYRRPITATTLMVDPYDIMIADRTDAIPAPHRYIYRGEHPDSAKICVAIVAEGFTEAEMPQFNEYARQAVDAILEHIPFAEHADDFDFVAVETPSAQSGVAHPRAGQWPQSAFGSHFNTFGSERYLTSPHIHALYDAIAPLRAHHIIILANTATYGGGGIFNLYTITAACHELMPQVTVHEFGHSFAGLADEYFYPDDMMDATYPDNIEPWEPNITTRTDFTAKWPQLIHEGLASLVQGGGYRATGIWRGAQDCRMRTNTCSEFCHVCRNAIETVINWQTRPQDQCQNGRSD